MSAHLHLQPSKLGTKEYWDSIYGEELTNFQDHGDEGEVWFGIESVEKMKDWMLSNVSPIARPQILEIGSGNGTLLFSLAEAGYQPNLCTGIDYSMDAVQLATSVAEAHGFTDINFICEDFLADEDGDRSLMRTWDVILDKGTYDAMALALRDDTGKSPTDAYPVKVASHLKPGGFFLITSCNFTEEELRDTFVSSDTRLSYHSRIQHQTYTFGGKSGNICSSVAFQRYH